MYAIGGMQVFLFLKIISFSLWATPSTVIWEKRGRYPPQRLDLPRFLYVFVDDVYKDDKKQGFTMT